MKQLTMACGTAAVCAALALSPSALAQSTIDIPQPGGNVIQGNNGANVVDPQFSLWPIPNVSNNTTTSNSAIGQGNHTTGTTYLLGDGAGNVFQFATGGNIINPQVAVGTDNHSNNTAIGNVAQNDGNHDTTSVTGGPVVGHYVDGNGNVFQLEFLQGNIINPQIAIGGSNYSTNTSQGNVADDVGNHSSTTNTGGTPANALAYVDGNGNVTQIEILSNNIINPQISVGGSNTSDNTSQGNLAYDAGNHSTTTVTDPNTTVTGIPGIYTVTKTVTGNGNVTQIAILSNNVWNPQINIPLPGQAVPGLNTAHTTVLANDAQDSGNHSTVNADTVTSPPPSKNPVANALSKFESHVLGNGNVDQHATGSGNVGNPQVAVGATTDSDAATTEQVTTDAKPPKPSFTSLLKPKHTDTAKPGTSDAPKTKPKPKPHGVSDAVSHFKAAVKKALSPKDKS